MPSETRYKRSDQHTINGLAAYKLDITQTSSALLVAETYVGDDYVNAYWGIRVSKRTAEGVETEITNGTPQAQVSRVAKSSGIQSANWACPQTPLNLTDSIVVRVYIRLNLFSWVLKATFTTEQLNASQLDPVTWTVYYWTELLHSRFWDDGTQWYVSGARFRFGSLTYNSRIENFSWTQSSPPPVESKQHSGTLIGVGIF